MHTRLLVCLIVLATCCAAARAQCAKWIGSVVVPITECACACPVPTTPITLPPACIPVPPEPPPLVTVIGVGCRREFSNDAFFPGSPGATLGLPVYCDAVKPCCPGCACDGTPAANCGASYICYTEQVTLWSPASCILSNGAAEYNSMLAAIGITFSSTCKSCVAVAPHCSDSWTTAVINLLVGVEVRRCYRWVWVTEVYCNRVLSGTQNRRCSGTQTSTLQVTKITGDGCTFYCETCPVACP